MAVPYYSEGNTDRNPPSQYPINPPPRMVQDWVERFAADRQCVPEQVYIANRAAQWGADQELEACREWISKQDWAASSGSPVPAWTSAQLLAARRPKPLSLKQQAIAVLDDVDASLGAAHYNVLLRALEALPDE